MAERTKDREIPEVSVVIPVKDEEDNVHMVARQVSAALGESPWSWECLWVDDGSTDGTLEALKDVAARDRRHRFISFGTNKGQSAAFWAGFHESRGRIIATIDGDGQNDPSDLPGLISQVLSGRCDMANGYRGKRQDTFVRKASSRIANAFRNAVTGRTVRDVGCSTRAFRRECVGALVPFRGMHRFMPTLVAMAGFRLDEREVAHHPRLNGTSKYGIGNRLWVGLFDTFGVFWLRKRHFALSALVTFEGIPTEEKGGKNRD